MRSCLIASVLFVAVGVSAAHNSPFLRLEQTSRAGRVQLAVKNVSQKPIVAYLVAVESPNHRSVLHGVYTGKDALAMGQSATVGEADAPMNQVKASVDYVSWQMELRGVMRRRTMLKRFPLVSTNELSQGVSC
jgi:hypothetical protein